MANTILAIDHDGEALQLLKAQLEVAGYSVKTARTCSEGLRLFSDISPKIVITELKLPDKDGFHLCREIRLTQSMGSVYILALSNCNETHQIVEAFNAGANDFLKKPFDQYELLARLHAGTRVLQLEQELAKERLTIHKANSELVVLNKKLQELATTDVLTHLPNRREAIRLLNELWTAAENSNQPLACMMIDIDHFKKYNDQYGHEAGDTVLRSTANILKSVIRAGETVCRIGGEELLVLCPSSSEEAAVTGAERLRRVVESNKVTHGDSSVAVTISIGISSKNNTMKTAEDLLKSADTALYTAKRNGRNRVCVDGYVQENADKTKNAEGCSRLESDSKVFKILIVDDDPAIRQLCHNLFETKGHEVFEACDGVEGVDCAKESMPDLILMDVEMPRLDGLSCLRQLKEDPVTAHISVIMVSARSEGSDIEAALDAGADDYITKPFKPMELIYRVQSVMRLHLSKTELLKANSVRGAQARSLLILLELSRRLSTCTDLDTALDQVITSASELTLSRRISIMLPDESGEYLVVAKSIGLDPQVASRVRVAIGGDTAGQVFLSKEPMVVNSPNQTTDSNAAYDSEFFVSAPLISRTLRTTDRVVGVLNITDRYDCGNFEAIDVESIDLICHIAAAAVDGINSRKARDEAQTAIMIALANLAEHRDDDTGKHLERVTKFTLMLAKELRTKPQYQDEIDATYLADLERAVPMHDIGKVAIPDRILLKPGKLTPEEMAIMRSHVNMGANTIQTVLDETHHVSFLKMSLEIILGHHEWYDGGGYPKGVSGEDIPLCARIAAVADVYDALTTSRPYKKAFSHEKASGIIRESIGTHFDPIVSEVFFKLEKQFEQLSIELGDQQKEEDAGERDRSSKPNHTPLAEAG